MISARERFRQNKSLVTGWNDICDSPQFLSAVEAAMLTFQSEFPLAPDMATAAANEWRRQGANRFLAILTQLNAQTQTSPPTPGGDKAMKYTR